MINSGIQTIGYINFSFGTSVRWQNLVGAVSIHNIFAPSESWTGDPQGLLPTRYSTQLAYHFAFAEQLSITPYTYYEKQKDFHELNIGIITQKKALRFGAAYRNADAIYSVGRI